MFIYYKSEDITYLVLILNATNHSALLFLLLISSAKASRDHCCILLFNAIQKY